jgi:hypothetical protein
MKTGGKEEAGADKKEEAKRPNETTKDTVAR